MIKGVTVGFENHQMSMFACFWWFPIIKSSRKSTVRPLVDVAILIKFQLPNFKTSTLSVPSAASTVGKVEDTLSSVVTQLETINNSRDQ